MCVAIAENDIIERAGIDSSSGSLTLSIVNAGSISEQAEKPSDWDIYSDSGATSQCICCCLVQLGQYFVLRLDKLGDTRALAICVSLRDVSWMDSDDRTEDTKDGLAISMDGSTL